MGPAAGLAEAAGGCLRPLGACVLAVWRLGRDDRPSEARRLGRRPRARQLATGLPSLQFIYGRVDGEPAEGYPADNHLADRPALVTRDTLTCGDVTLRRHAGYTRGEAGVVRPSSLRIRFDPPPLWGEERFRPGSRRVLLAGAPIRWEDGEP
jgi:hypothetical protein